MSDALKKIKGNLPSVFDLNGKTVLSALIIAIAESDNKVSDAIGAAKNNLFVRTATGQSLTNLGSSVGVDKPFNLGLSDEKFQELIPNLSLKPKQIKKAFLDTAEVFWGKRFTRANIRTTNFAPFNISTGDIFSVIINGKTTETVKVSASEVAVSGSATALELSKILSRVKGITAEVEVDAIDQESYVVIISDTPGTVGSIEFLSTSGIGASKINLPTKKLSILDLPQRVAIYNINPKELIIELPAILTNLTGDLNFSHYLHPDETIETVDANGKIWRGLFLYSEGPTAPPYTITSQVLELDQDIVAGEIYSNIDVIGANNLDKSSGFLIFSFGFENEEVPVPYSAIINNNNLLLNSSYKFTKNHSSGDKINFISSRSTVNPKTNLDDLAIFLLSPSESRKSAQTLLTRLAAAGIRIKFKILAPEYSYLIDNPYLG